MIYLELFLNFLYIGVLSFGGGYAVLPLIQQQCVEGRGWLNMTEFSDLLTISQITPGPIAINAATFVGFRVGGVGGAFLATFSFLLPPFIIVSVLYLIYKKYKNVNFMQDILSALKPAVVGLIAIAALNILVETLWGGGSISLAGTDIFLAVLTLLTFVIVRKWKTGIIPTVLACGVVGVLWEVIVG